MSRFNTKFDNVFEDTVQCYFFSVDLHKTDTYWTDLCDKINDIVQNLSYEYIWHRDEFKVYLPLCCDKDIPDHLKSTTCFGDNIEDEWFIVYLVLEITKHIKDLIVQIIDDDGDFLLIESADYLPSWANPDTTKNRVFIHDGQIHLITPDLASLDDEVTLKDALHIVSEMKDKTVAPLEVQQSILTRIGHYPENMSKLFHHAVVKLPLDIATVLILKPNLIAQLVNTYCHHDAIDAKICKKVCFDNCITVKLKFTKFLYAMLVHSKPLNNKHFLQHNADKAATLGLKLACGYYIIMSQSSSDLFSSKQFKHFLNNLKNNGYFQGNIEYSKAYNELLGKAKDYFLNMECPISCAVYNEVVEIMSSTDYKQLRESLENQNNLSPSDGDDEEWLNVGAEELDDFLNIRYGNKRKYKTNNTGNLSSQISEFLKHTSDFEGIEINDMDDDPKINLNPDEFVTSMQKMLDSLNTNQNSDDESIEDLTDSEGQGISDEEMEEERNNVVLENFIKSMKIEEGSSGPSSNLLHSIGINKRDIIDSDDDV